MSDANNPLWLVYQELWSVLRDSSAFVATFKNANQIDYFDEEKQFPDHKDTYTTSDFPAVKIVPSRAVAQIDASSDSAFLTLRWQIQVVTGEQSAKTELDIAWLIVRAMSLWRTRLWALKWNEKQFVGKAAFVETTETMDDKRENRGTRGWTAVWTGETELYFATTDLQA